MDALHAWCLENGMKVNIGKTKAMKFRRGGRLARSDKILYDGTILEFVNSYDYLGVSFQTNLSVKKH